MGGRSLVMVKRDWYEFSSLVLAAVRMLDESAMDKVFLDCSEVVALMKLCSCSISLVSDWVIGENLHICYCYVKTFCHVIQLVLE